MKLQLSKSKEFILGFQTEYQDGFATQDIMGAVRIQEGAFKTPEAALEAAQKLSWTIEVDEITGFGTLVRA